MAEGQGPSSNGLLQRIAHGDKAAMRELIGQYGPLVWSLARSFTSSAADAEDAAQDVFVHLWKKAGQYDPAHGLEVQFVSVLTRRRLIDWLRAHSKPNSELLRSYQSSVRIEMMRPSDVDPEAARAWDVLSKLVAEQQSALVLSIVHGMTHEQIARHLQIPLGTVKTNLYRGLAALRDQVGTPRIHGGETKGMNAPQTASEGGHAR